jgi:hypothetical protein
VLEQHPIILVGMPFEDEAGILSAGGDEYEEDHARLVDGLRATMGSSADANDSERARVACSLDISRDLEPVDITQVELIRQEIAFLEDDSEINMTGFVYVGSEGRHVHGGHTDDSGQIPQAFSPDLGTTIILPGLDEYCCIVRLGLYCYSYIGLSNILLILLLLRLLLDVPPQ